MYNCLLEHVWDKAYGLMNHIKLKLYLTDHMWNKAHCLIPHMAYIPNAWHKEEPSDTCCEKGTYMFLKAYKDEVYSLRSISFTIPYGNIQHGAAHLALITRHPQPGTHFYS